MAISSVALTRGAVACVLSGLVAGCGANKGDGELHAKVSVLEREVKGLRASVAKLESGEPILPEEAVVVAIAEAVVRQFIDAQLPFVIEVESFRIEMKGAQASFKGSPSVTLEGSIAHRDHPDYVGVVRAIGALESIQVDSASGTLRAQLAVDHVDLLEMGGLEKILPGDTLDDLGQTVRAQLAGEVPEIQIPVKIEQAIALPSITEGPVRLQGASMPLAVSVADVFASQGLLWVAINVVPGELARAAPSAPPARRRQK